MIVVLTSNPQTGWHLQDLQRAASEHKINLVIRSWQQVRSELQNHTSRVYAGDLCLNEAKAILCRTIGPGSLEQIVLRMDLLSQLQQNHIPVINPQRAIETAVDKYLSLAQLTHAGLPIPPTAVCQSLAEARVAFEQLGGDVVLKPLFGAEGFGLTRVCDPQLADRAFDQLQQMGNVIYLQKFLPHQGSDLRLFVLGDQILGAMRRKHDDWRTNIARGAVGEPHQPTSFQSDLALRAARACQTVIAGVDLLEADDGQTYVLEVNAIPGWRKLAQVTQIDVAGHILQFAQQQAATAHAPRP